MQRVNVVCACLGCFFATQVDPNTNEWSLKPGALTPSQPLLLEGCDADSLMLTIMREEFGECPVNGWGVGVRTSELVEKSNASLMRCLTTTPTTNTLLGPIVGAVPVEWIKDIWSTMPVDLFGTGPFHLQLGSTMLPMVRAYVRTHARKIGVNE